MNSGRFAIGVDIGGTGTKAAIVDSDGAVRCHAAFPTAGDSASEFVRNLCDLIFETKRNAEARNLRVSGIGIAVAGFVNGTHDRLAYNPNLAWLEEYPLLDAIRSEVDLPMVLECDSNAAALAEYRFGTGKGSQRFLCIACGTGVGGGMIVSGEILRYAWECLGDVGHVIVDPDGPLCACGGRGCIEAMAGAEAIAARWRSSSAGARGATLRDVIAAAREGDGNAREVLRESGRLLGVALATLTNILSPDRIAIAGGLSEADELILAPAEEALRASASTYFEERVTISKAALGVHATLVGAACPILREVNEMDSIGARGAI
ncbi:MAG: ROK family protein [Bryobacteraceae bacterium]